MPTNKKRFPGWIFTDEVSLELRLSGRIDADSKSVQQDDHDKDGIKFCPRVRLQLGDFVIFDQCHF